MHLFVANTCSLRNPHLVWTTATNSFECRKASVVAKMVSGRFRSEYLTRHWSKNKLGYCLAETCTETIGTLEHLLVHCPALSAVRQRMWSMFFDSSVMFPPLYTFLRLVEKSLPQTQLQFLLDPTAFPEILEIGELCGQPAINHVYYITRTYAYYLYRQKQILLGLWTTDSFRTQFNKKCAKRDIHLTNINNKISLTNPPLITGSSTPDVSTIAHHHTNIEAHLPRPATSQPTQQNMEVVPLLSAKQPDPYTAFCFDHIDQLDQSCTCCGGVGCLRCTTNQALAHVLSIPCNAGSALSEQQLATTSLELLPLPDHDQGHVSVCDAGTDGLPLGSQQSYHSYSITHQA